MRSLLLLALLVGCATVQPHVDITQTGAPVLRSRAAEVPVEEISTRCMRESRSPR